jgi:hypothetical protein
MTQEAVELTSEELKKQLKRLVLDGGDVYVTPATILNAQMSLGLPESHIVIRLSEFNTRQLIIAIRAYLALTGE